MTRFGSIRRGAAVFGILGLLGGLAAGASSLGACTSGTTPDCGDASQCGVVVISDAQPESGDDALSYTMESGAESGPDEGGLEAGSMDAEGGSPDSAGGSDASDSGSPGDTGVIDANDGGSRDAPADG